MKREHFVKVVEETLDSLPQEFRSRIRNVAVLVEDVPRRLSILLECAQQSLCGLLAISGVEAGLQIAGWLHRGLNAESVATAAATRGVEVTALIRYRQGAAVREGLQLGFAAVDSREIRRGVRELAIALENELKTLHSNGSSACR